MQLQVNNVSINVERQGKETDPLLVLVNPLMSTIICWRWVVPLLVENNYQVLMYDQVGHGASGLDSDDTMEGLVTILEGIVEQVGINPRAVIGCSLGAVIAARYSIKTGTRAVLVSIPGLATLDPAIQSYKDRIAAAEQGKLKFELSLMTMQRWFKHNDSLSAKVKGEMTQAAQATSPEGYIRCIKALMNYKYDAREFKTTPLLIAGGADDDNIKVAMQELVEDILGGDGHKTTGQELQIARNAGHVVMVEQPEEFVGLILNYLS